MVIPPLYLPCISPVSPLYHHPALCRAAAHGPQRHR
jgi:hypothetical protein